MGREEKAEIERLRRLAEFRLDRINENSVSLASQEREIERLKEVCAALRQHNPVVCVDVQEAHDKLKQRLDELQSKLPALAEACVISGIISERERLAGMAEVTIQEIIYSVTLGMKLVQGFSGPPDPRFLPNLREALKWSSKQYKG